MSEIETANSTIVEVRNVEDLRKLIPAAARPFFADELFWAMSHANPEVGHRGPVVLKNLSAIYTDGRNFTLANVEQPELAKKLYESWREEKNRHFAAEYPQVRMIKGPNAGDEDSIFLENATLPLLLAISLDSTIIFLEELNKPEFRKLKKILFRPGGRRPVCIGITEGRMGFIYARSKSSAHPIISGPNLLAAKGIGVKGGFKDHFIRHGEELMPLFSPTPLKTLPDMVVGVRPNQYELYEKMFQKAGLEVSRPTKEAPYVTIYFPPGETIPAVLEKLKKASEVIKENVAQNHLPKPAAERPVRLNLKEIHRLAKLSMWQIDRQKQEGKEQEPPEVTDAVFLTINGLNQLRGYLERSGIDEDSIELAIVASASYLYTRISDEMAEQCLAIENAEVNEHDVLKLIMGRNVTLIDEKRPRGFHHYPEVFWHIAKCIQKLQAADIKEEVLNYLREIWPSGKEPLPEQVLLNALKEVEFRSAVGMVTTELDPEKLAVDRRLIEEPRPDEYLWYLITGGGSNSIAARICGVVINLRVYSYIDDLIRKIAKSEEGLTPEEEICFQSWVRSREKIEKFYWDKIPTIGMQYEAWVTLGKPFEEEAVILDVALKGFVERRKYVIVPIIESVSNQEPITT